MAANYWASHASASLVSKQALANSHREDRARGLTETHIRQIKVHLINQIWELARACKLRSRVAATASVYFARFFTRHSFGGASHDPRLVAVGCLYLAAKTEETLLAAKHLVIYAKRHLPAWPYEIKHLLDSEMVITQGLHFYLIVYHPYRPLLEYARDAGLPPALARCAWAVANDLFRTDLVLMFPPHVLALACLVYAWGASSGSRNCGGGSSPPPQQEQLQQQHPSSVLVGGPLPLPDCVGWLLQLNIDAQEVLGVVEEIGEAYMRPVPPLSSEECRKLLELANMVVPLRHALPCFASPR